MDNQPSAELVSVAFQRLADGVDKLLADTLTGLLAALDSPEPAPQAHVKYYGERRAAAREPFEAGAPYEDVLAIVNAMPGPPWSKKDLQNQGTIHGWRRPFPHRPAADTVHEAKPAAPLRSAARADVLRQMYCREGALISDITDRLNGMAGPALSRQDITDWVADLELRRPASLSPHAIKPAPAPDPRPPSVVAPKPPRKLLPLAQPGDPAVLPSVVEPGHTASVMPWAEALGLARDLGLIVLPGTSPASLRGMINDALGKNGHRLVTVLAPRPGDATL